MHYQPLVDDLPLMTSAVLPRQGQGERDVEFEAAGLAGLIAAPIAGGMLTAG